MAPDPFNGLTEFLAVADARSFTAAAASLGVTPTAVSQTIRALETRLGVPLFVRTSGASRSPKPVPRSSSASVRLPPTLLMPSTCWVASATARSGTCASPCRAWPCL
ncbi:helix-turn-helix domain-containing protein [Rhizobium ruizarguesonis]|uniref:helix-turn-helix domain-containing protein n=1 Tax=Rhizobium ruizarguesonis TaxID=2081791 RepID=UPI001FE0EFB3|nr:LysR family transcriptional regulator [Rhizobium ruizarguesonis]